MTPSNCRSLESQITMASHSLIRITMIYCLLFQLNGKVKLKKFRREKRFNFSMLMQNMILKNSLGILGKFKIDNYWGDLFINMPLKIHSKDTRITVATHGQPWNILSGSFLNYLTYKQQYYRETKILNNFFCIGCHRANFLNMNIGAQALPISAHEMAPMCAFSVLQKRPKIAKMTPNDLLTLEMVLTEPSRNT